MRSWISTAQMLETTARIANRVAVIETDRRLVEKYKLVFGKPTIAATS